MRKTTTILGFWAGCLLATSGSAWAQTASVANMLAIKPKFDDVAITTPAAEEFKDCEVKDFTVQGKKVGLELVDGRRQTLRRFFASKDQAKMNVWSFYKEGVEVFRQVDSNLDGKVDQYRWLGTAGLKWGIDRDQDGKIDSWHMISAEEVAHEAFLALATGDFVRLQALYITPAEIQELGLPAAAAAKIVQAQQTAQSRFQQAVAKQPNLARSSFLRVESAAPGCWLADSIGASKDVTKFASRSILYETADKKHDWFQTGEMIQVGLAWRLIDVATDVTEAVQNTDPQLNKFLAQLAEVDEKITKTPNTNPAQPNPALASLNEQRASLAEQIVAAVKESTEKETWYKQILDSLASAAIAGSEKAGLRLKAYREQLVAKMPGTNLAAYATFRELWSQFSPKLTSTVEGPKAQEAWHEQLGRFVKDYPKADDTPDALHQLGMGCEFSGTKEKDEEAAKWYRAIHANFPEHYLAEWAKGAERRLKLTGNPLELSGILLQGNAAFNINQLKGKIVLVHYWASHTTSCPADFARLKQALTAHKDVDLVCVNLDAKADGAVAFLQQNPIQAYHVAQAAKDQNGLRGALANYYGINVLPTLFLVGRDGLVVNSKLQLADLDEALKKATTP